MNSTLDSATAPTVPAAMAAAFSSLKRRAKALKEPTSSSLLMTSGATHRPVPLMTTLCMMNKRLK